MKNKIKLCILLIVFGIYVINVIISNITVIFADELDVLAPAKAMCVIEGNTNTILYSFNDNVRLPMASTTKIATAIVAIESCENLDEKFVVSSRSIGIEGTSMYLKDGEVLSTRELLYGLILASGNDASVALAERFGGLEVFVDKMNNLVETLGLNNTHFDNPHGLDSDTHYTSAYDLAIITSYAMQNEIFREIVSTQRIVIDETNLYQQRFLKHKNKLLFSDENCVGVKTGFTDNAGRCLVNAHNENGMLIISVVLNCSPMFEECDRLTRLAIDNYIMKEFVSPYSFVTDVDVIDSKKSKIGIVTVEKFEKPILIGSDIDYDIKYNYPNCLQAPIELNQVVGNVQVLYNGDVIYQGDLITIDSADNNDIKYLLDGIIDKWF